MPPPPAPQRSGACPALTIPYPAKKCPHKNGVFEGEDQNLFFPNIFKTLGFCGGKSKKLGGNRLQRPKKRQKPRCRHFLKNENSPFFS